MVKAERTDAVARDLAFDQPDGPLIAVCGIVGGAGATTVAACLASQIAGASAMPVLLADDSGDGGGLAEIVGAASGHSFSELAERVASGDGPANPFLEVAAGLRVVASHARCQIAASEEVVRELLQDARAAHGAVVVDCGSDWHREDPVLSAATHILWTVPARAVAVRRTHTAVENDQLPPRGRASETLVAVGVDPRPTTSIREMRRVAATRWDQLALMPYCDELAAGSFATPSASAVSSLIALTRVVRGAQ